MATTYSVNGPSQPIVLSMEGDDDVESEYRFRIGNQIRYLVVSPNTFDREALWIHQEFLSGLPYDQEWNVARISRDETTGELTTRTETRELAGVRCRWRSIVIDCMELEMTEQLTQMTFKAISHSTRPGFPAPLIVKLARFESDIPRIERETRAYQRLMGSGIAPRFFGHVHENGRIIGFLLEKIKGQSATLKNLDICKAALVKLHELGLRHGDLNRHNFIVSGDQVKIVDFEHAHENPTSDEKWEELWGLKAALYDPETD